MTARAYLGWGFEGKFTPDDPTAFKREFMKAKRTRMVVFAKQFFPKRSNPANAYYHAVVVRMIGEEIEGPNYDHEGTHEMLKAEHNTIIAVTKGGVEVKKILSTKMDSKDFWAYVERCRAWARDFLNIHIPEPREEYSKALMEEYRMKAEGK